MSQLNDDELREIADEAREWYANDGAPNIRLPVVVTPEMAYGYAQGVIAERLRQRAESEGRDGLARRLARALSAHRDYIFALRGRSADRLEALCTTDALLAEARAQGLLDEPATHTTQPTTVPSIGVPALKVEHPALSEPHYWPWPNDKTARDDLAHRTVWRWLREQIGESREMVTFTVINLPSEDDEAASLRGATEGRR